MKVYEHSPWAHTNRTEQVGSSGEASNLCLGGTHFEFRPKHSPDWAITLINSVSIGKCWDTYLRSWALLQKLPIVPPLKNFPALYGTRKFITLFTRALHWFLSWTRSIQSIPSHPISLRSILILSTHLRLCLPSGLFPCDFPTIILYGFLFSPFVLHIKYLDSIFN
jgi:hypothetical protein